MADKSTIQFRQMLAKLSNLIKSNELETMKYICADIIPRAFLEDIDTAVKLWIALEERDKISSDNTSFLETLLETGCPGRTDVLKELENYNKNVLVEDTEDLQKEFDLISENLGREWRPLARALGLSEANIDQINQKYNPDLQEQIRQTLVMWQRHNRSKANKDALIQALRFCKKNMLAHQITIITSGWK